MSDSEEKEEDVATPEATDATKPAATRADDYKNAVMQDIYNDISSDDEESDGDDKKLSDNVPAKSPPPKQISKEDREALKELYDGEEQPHH
jgi:hypothetical protein